MAIGTTYAPYIHSNKANYLDMVNNQKIYNASGKTDPMQEITEIISELQMVRSSLKSRADAFLGKNADGVTQQELREIFEGSNSDSATLQHEAMEILLSQRTIDILTEEQAYDKNVLEDAMKKAGVRETLIKKALSEYKVTPTQLKKDIADAIGSSLKNVMEGSAKEQISQIEAKIMKKGSMKNFLTQPFRNEKNLKKTIAEEISSRLNLEPKDAGQKRVNNFCNYFREQMAIRCSKIDKEVFNKYVNSCIKDFKASFSKLSTNASNVAGARSEIGVAILINNNSNNGITITVTGSMNEDKVEEEMQNIYRKEGVNGLIKKIKENGGVIKERDKQSYSDWLVTRNGVTVRVQSKDNRQALSAFFENGQDRTNYIELAKDTPILTFMEKMDNTYNKLNYNPKEFGYVMGNEAWFSIRSSYGGGRKKGAGAKYQGQSGAMNNNSNVAREMITIYLNYIGVVLDKTFDVNQNVNSDASNIFWFLSGEGYVPTYEFIDGILDFFREEKANISTFKIRIKLKKENLPTGRQFYLDKINALNESLTGEEEASKAESRKASYTDQALLDVGTSVGARLLDNYLIESTKLTIPSISALLTRRSIMR